jgi:NADH-quinone oxidoreductase subunit G
MHHENGGVTEFVPAARLGNVSTASIDLNAAVTEPVVAAIYQLDGTLRRATSLQLTADGRAAATQSAQEALA